MGIVQPGKPATRGNQSHPQAPGPSRSSSSTVTPASEHSNASPGLPAGSSSTHCQQPATLVYACPLLRLFATHSQQPAAPRQHALSTAHTRVRRRLQQALARRYGAGTTSKLAPLPESPTARHTQQRLQTNTVGCTPNTFEASPGR